MIRLQKNAPLVSSAGRLFDAVAGAIGLCRESVSFEGQAAMELQVLAEEAVFNSESDGCGYPFKIGIWPSNGLPYLDLHPWIFIFGPVWISIFGFRCMEFHIWMSIMDIHKWISI